MKILALEKEIENSDWSNADDILKEEALHVYQLQKEEIIREIYFTENRAAVLVLECKNKQEALSLLNEFPLVKDNLIMFDVFELHAYSGIERLFEK